MLEGKYLGDGTSFDKYDRVDHFWYHTHLDRPNHTLDTINRLGSMDDTDQPDTSQSQIFKQQEIFFVSDFIIDSDIRS